MKKTIILFSIILSNLFLSQKSNKDVENSLFNVQIGIVGIWLNNEAKITKNTILRSEIGLSAGFWGGDLL